MIVRKNATPPQSEEPKARLVQLTAKELGEMIGVDVKVGVSRVQLKQIRAAKAAAEVDKL